MAADMMETDSFDIREFDHLNPVKDQGDCRSCTAFCACLTVEHMVRKLFGYHIVLSPQDVYENIILNETMEKQGPSLEAAFVWMTYRGCVSEETRPYRQTWMGGQMENRNPLFSIKGYETIPLEDMERYLRNNGPIVVGFPWIHEMNHIRDEIYRGPADPIIWTGADKNGHAVVVIGYGRERVNGEDVNFWLIQNSHGEGWGQNGYGRFDANIKLPNGNLLINGGVAPKAGIDLSPSTKPKKKKMNYTEEASGKRQRFFEQKKQDHDKEDAQKDDEAPKPGGMKLGVEHSLSMIPIVSRAHTLILGVDVSHGSTAAEPKLFSGLKLYYLGEEVSILWQRPIIEAYDYLTANTVGHTWIWESIAASCDQTCTDPLTSTPFGSPCGCVFPIKVRLTLDVPPYAVFPVMTEFEYEVAPGTYVELSQVVIMGAAADNQNQGRTIVDINLVRLGDKFDNTTAALTYERFWHKKVPLNRSIFGDYAVVYITYPGIPSSPPYETSIGSGPSQNADGSLPVSADFASTNQKMNLRTIIIIALSSSVTLKWRKTRGSSSAVGPAFTSSLNKRSGLEDGAEVAGMLLTRDNNQNGDREFIAEDEMLSRLHHSNLLKLIGVCIEGRKRCLVYELVPNGSVESHLHGDDKNRGPLDWELQMKIALGAARGLLYLHEDSNPRVIHRDFKASNVLLEDKFTPKVSDFGLAREATEGSNYISTRVMRTFGYVAPEYAMTGHLLFIVMALYFLNFSRKKTSGYVSPTRM